MSAFNGTARNIGVGAGVAIASALYTSQLEVRGAEGIGDAVRFAFLVVGCLTTIGVVAAALIGKTRPE